MQNSKNFAQFVLEHYYESWWKVKDQPIWYLAGKHFDELESLKAGKWYFTNEADMFSAPFDTYEACKKALDLHDEYLIL